MIRKRKRLWTLFLSVALIVTQLPAAALAESKAPGVAVPKDGSIASFEPFNSGVADQTVDVGSPLSALTLPDTVTAAVYHVMDDTVNTHRDDSVSGNSPGDFSRQENGKTAPAVTTSTKEIPVTWESEPAYDGDAAGKYVFTADTGGYTLSNGVKPPQIAVTVANGSPVKTVSGWTFVDDDFLNGGVLPLNGVSMDNQADFDTVVSLLPTQIRGSIEGEAEPATLDIAGWSCPEYIQAGGSWPLTGDYVFTAALPAGFACDTLPTVKVTLGGISVMTINDRFSAGGLRYKELGPDTVQLIGYDGTNPTGALTIPSSVTRPSNGRAYTVVSIGGSAFFGCSGFTGGLTLPSTLTQIGDHAFSGCSGFTGGLTLPSRLTQIGDHAFGNCSGFTGGLTLPSRLTQIGDYAFSGCSGFTGGLTLPSTLTQIGDNAFWDCSGFTGGLTLPSRLTQIGDNAFQDCSGFTGSLTLPFTLIRIGHSAFSGSGFTAYNTSSQAVGDLLYNSGLKATLIQVGNHSYAQPKEFKYNGMVYRITGANTVTLIGYSRPGAAAGSLTIPETVMENAVFYTVTAIGDHAFQGCSGFTGGLTLPSTLTQIGDYAFGDCSGFTGGLTLPSTLTQIGDYAFRDCNSFTGGLTLPSTLIRIGEGAFSDCSGFTGGLTLPSTLTQIGDYAFWDCSGFTGGLMLPAALTRIGRGAFWNCSGFTGGLTLPSMLTQIGGGAFGNCSGFTGGLTLPSTLIQIGQSAFSGCSGLASAHLGSSLQKLGADAFPPGISLFADSPRVQLLINEYLNHDTVADTAWNGGEDVPDGAIATVKRDAAVSGNKRIGREAEITVPDGVILTVDGTLTVDGSLTVNGTLRINGILTGSGTLYIGKGGKVEGDISGIRVEYPADMEDARKLMESHSYTVTQDKANDWKAVQSWLVGEIADISGLNHTGVSVGTITVTSFTPAVRGNAVTPNGTNGGFTFTAAFSKGNGTGQAAGSGSITAAGYQPSGGGSSSEPEPQSSYTVTGDSISLTVSRSDLKKLADSGKSLTLRCDKAGMSFDPAALKAILAAVPSTAGGLTFTAVPVDLSPFPDAAKLTGARPAYDFAISYRDDRGNAVRANVNFPAGSAAITLNYTPAALEVTGSLFMVYVDGEGAVTWLNHSCYDAGRVLAEVSHFSIYGVAYRTPVPAFTDVTDHWAKEDIEFAAARGLLSGTGNNRFSPDGVITRGMFVTALGRLAGVDPDSYKTRSFTDVKADARYAAYVEWAAQKNIVKGTGDRLFSPNAPVTREQMAVIMADYAGQMGYSIPAPLAAAAFADNDKISSWAAKKVTVMQRAGIVRGRDGNRFDPQGNATRAEGSAALHRFVEIVIDPSTAGGWATNDSGHRLYYQGGRALTGWQTIGGLRYCFNPDGVMAVNTQIDGYEIGPDGTEKENN